MVQIGAGLAIVCALAVSASAATPPADLKPFPEQGTYVAGGKTFECGLYPGGRNEMPEAHRKAGERIAATVAPLDTQGKPDPANGKIVMLAAGHSNPAAYFGAYGPFLREAAAKGEINPRVTLVNQCGSGKMCQDWAAEFRAGPRNMRRDAQVLLLLTSYHRANRANTQRVNPEVLAMSFEERTRAMKADLKVILQGFVKACPQIKIAYLGCDTWRGNVGLEPMVWEEAFAFKQIIEDQIKGDPDLAFEGPNRKAPWLAWGGYIWENNPPKDRFAADGVHPSDSGKAFACGRWHDVLLRAPGSKAWFLPPAAGK